MDTLMTLKKTTDEIENDWINTNAFIFLGSGADVMMWCYDSEFCFVTYRTRDFYLPIHQRVSCYAFQCSIKLENISCIYLLLFIDLYVIMMLNKILNSKSLLRMLVPSQNTT